MPVQKGKKRRKPRHRVTRSDEPGIQLGTAEPVRQKAAPPTRRGLNLPWWVNGLVGLIIILVGIFFYIHPAHGTTHTWQLIFLLGYFVIGGLYVGKAYRQFASRPNR